jgi:carbon storage regulator
VRKPLRRIGSSDVGGGPGSELGPPATRSERTCPILVLSRKKNEKIMLGDDIEIVVVEIRGDKVRLGIAAPQGLPVHRLEVYEAIHRGDPKPEPDHATGGA